MSNSGQAGSAIIGGIIGFFVGGPTGAMYGIQLGLLAGTVLFPTQLPQQFGPRMEDMQSTTAQVGVPVIETWGTITVPGTVMWLGPRIEIVTTEEVGGKGGPEQTQTTYTYFQSIAVGLCGSFDRPIGGILRIWENGKLVYDVRPQQDDETAQEYLERTEASFLYTARMTVYTGAVDQLPDPVIEQVEGVGNVPAFRDLAYVVFYERHLSDEQARRHPQWRFEVYDGVTDRERIPPTFLPGGILEENFSSTLVVDWARGRYVVMDTSGGEDEEGFRVYRTSDNTEILQVLFTDALAGTPRPYPNIGIGALTIGYLGHIYFPWFTSGDNLAIARLNPDTLLMEMQRAAGGASDFWDEAVTVYVPGYGDVIYSVSVTGPYFSRYDGTTMIGGMFWTPPPGYDDGKVCRGLTSLLGRAYAYAIACDHSTTTSQPLLIHRPSAVFHPLLLVLAFEDEQIGSIAASAIDATWTRFSDIRLFLFDAWDQTLLIGVVGGPAGSTTERLIKWDPETDAIIWNIETSLPAFHSNNNLDRVQNHRLAWARTTSTRYLDTRDGTYVDIDWGPQGQVGSFNGESVFDGGSNRMITFESTVGPVVLEFGHPSPEDVSLATIVARVCDDCGLTDDDINVTDLETIFVHGYARTRPMSGRATIEPTRMIGFWDSVESDSVLKFVTRGKAAVATVTADELSAHESGQEAPPAVTTRKIDAVELPRMIRVHYMAPSRDYEPGEQISPVRLTTDAVNDVDVDLVAALDDDQAAQIAEIIWADAWRARWVHDISFDRYWTELEPADAVIVPVDGRNERMRIATLTASDLILRRAELVRDDDGSYESTAVADVPARPPSRLTLNAATEILLMDLPALREEDDDAGFYAAARRTGIGTTWNGAVIYRSADGGGSWVQVGAVANEATVGRVNTALPVGITSTWDYENEIDVVVPTGTTLESRTEAAVLLGANAAAIGVNGRWEIVQFLNAEVISANRYRLTTLLRGRRGTEHIVGTSAANDYFVLVSGPGIIRLPLTTAQIGAELIYRAVTIGSQFIGALSQAFTGNGMALETFSPVHILGSRDEMTDDLTITWIRRDRLHQTMSSGIEVPNSEASESYSIDIIDVDDVTVLRTLTSSTTSVVYTSAQQTTDFGGPVAAVTVRVYQLSAIVGRGTPGESIV
jgi:hypothetical protein